MREVYGTIRKLGATSKYKGYYFVAEAIRMTMEFQERPMKITKDIYPKLAKKFKSKPSNIEHDIRTIVNVCWENHRERLEEIAGYPLEYRPTNSEFVDMIAFYLGDEKESKVQFFTGKKGFHRCSGNTKQGLILILEIQIQTCYQFGRK